MIGVVFSAAKQIVDAARSIHGSQGLERPAQQPVHDYLERFR
jgi:hypothetical protein